jgi:uncharacterized protein YndB with AHSA1/START domain
MADSTYTVQRSVRLSAPAEEVYEQIADFHNWTEWSPWEGLDPAMERTYSGSAAGRGAIYTWSGNRKAGQGRMEILGATTPSHLLIDLVFEKPWKSHSVTEFTIEPSGAGSEVTWSMNGPNTFMTRVMGIFKSMDSLLGPDFEKGLAKLKSNLET